VPPAAFNQLSRARLAYVRVPFFTSPVPVATFRRPDERRAR